MRFNFVFTEPITVVSPSTSSVCRTGPDRKSISRRLVVDDQNQRVENGVCASVGGCNLRDR